MSLPTTRDETIVAGGPITHTMINRLQDQVVGANHGTVTGLMSPTKGQGVNWVKAGVGAMTTAQNAELTIPLDVRVGDIIVGFGGWGSSNTSTMTLKLRSRVLGAGLLTELGTTAVFIAGEAYRTGTIASGEPDPTKVTVVANTVYWLDFLSNAAGSHFAYGADFQIQHIG